MKCKRCGYEFESHGEHLCSYCWDKVLNDCTHENCKNEDEYCRRCPMKVCTIKDIHNVDVKDDESVEVEMTYKRKGKMHRSFVTFKNVNDWESARALMMFQK